ncbi:MAG: MBL fold metallo-hydrolase [Lachnospiraceae bacterium]|nr:MBL fold metallo-hydrolase [Lachnospiraceae bacterium]
MKKRPTQKHSKFWRMLAGIFGAAVLWAAVFGMEDAEIRPSSSAAVESSVPSGRTTPQESDSEAVPEHVTDPVGHETADAGTDPPAATDRETVSSDPSSGLDLDVSSGERETPPDRNQPATDAEEPSSFPEHSEETAVIQPSSAQEVRTSEAVPTEAPSGPPSGNAEAPSGLRIQFIDVGQGDAALITCDGHSMMIDGGPASASNTIYSILNKNSIGHLDYIVATHGDADHVGGLSGALTYATAEKVYCNTTYVDTKTFRSFRDRVAARGLSIEIPAPGTTFNLGSAVCTVLSSTEYGVGSNASVVIRITHGKFSFLFMGDADRTQELYLVNNGLLMESTVLKVAHHGSNTSTSYVFLNAVMPEYAVISVGQNNGYGHPTDEVLSRFRDEGATVFRTDMQGDIFCSSTGTALSFTTARNSGIDTLASVRPPETQTPTTREELVLDGGSESVTGIGRDIPSETEPASETAAPTTAAPTTVTPTQPPTQPSGSCTYIANLKSHVFHRPDCASVKRMSEANKWYFTGTRDELISQEYTPCKNCNP